MSYIDNIAAYKVAGSEDIIQSETKFGWISLHNYWFWDNFRNFLFVK